MVNKATSKAMRVLMGGLKLQDIKDKELREKVRAKVKAARSNPDHTIFNKIDNKVESKSQRVLNGDLELDDINREEVKQAVQTNIDAINQQAGEEDSSNIVYNPDHFKTDLESRDFNADDFIQRAASDLNNLPQVYEELEGMQADAIQKLNEAFEVYPEFAPDYIVHINKIGGVMARLQALPGGDKLGQDQNNNQPSTRDLILRSIAEQWPELANYLDSGQNIANNSTNTNRQVFNNPTGMVSPFYSQGTQNSIFGNSFNPLAEMFNWD